ncbi:18434_t:CDS:10 [Funneliformis geosporum]|uniref:18434_t:CDS:1 n=1 Tax=Funneliformis geosporum TaxID=1117311 RepID=A0A9W4WVY9_9GLOM|nr:18434_t:CDS:10 [Funneliformis geosporum]
MEDFADELKVDLEQINKLREYCESLITARKNHNQVGISTNERNITKIKQEILNKGIGIKKVQKLYKKCEKVAEIRIELGIESSPMAQQKSPTNINYSSGSKETEEKFKEISKAYQILSDLETRNLYDIYGEDFGSMGSSSGYSSSTDEIRREFAEAETKKQELKKQMLTLQMQSLKKIRNLPFEEIDSFREKMISAIQEVGKRKKEEPVAEDVSIKNDAIERIENLLKKRNVKAEELEIENRDYKKAVNNSGKTVEEILGVEMRIQDDIDTKEETKKRNQKIGSGQQEVNVDGNKRLQVLASFQREEQTKNPSQLNQSRLEETERKIRFLQSQSPQSPQSPQSLSTILIIGMLEKVNELIGKINNPNSSLCEKLGKYVREDEVDALLNKLITTYTVKTINKIRHDDLYNHLSVIFDILKSCDCRNELVNDYNQLVSKHNSASSQQVRVQMEVASLRTRAENYFSQLVEVRKMLENKEKEVVRIENKLDEKQQKTDNLLNRLAELKLESSEKVSELKRKDDEIKALKRNLGDSQKDFLNEKLKSKREKLETFATEIGIELQKTQNLRKRYRELISSQEENRGNDIGIAKENIEATREGLLERGINNSKIRKLCKKCKKTAQLEVWIEKIQERRKNKEVGGSCLAKGYTERGQGKIIKADRRVEKDFLFLFGARSSGQYTNIRQSKIRENTFQKQTEDYLEQLKPYKNLNKRAKIKAPTKIPSEFLPGKVNELISNELLINEKLVQIWLFGKVDNALNKEKQANFQKRQKVIQVIDMEKLLFYSRLHSVGHLLEDAVKQIFPTLKIVFVGIPGSGKSSIVKELASLLKVKYFAEPEEEK